ncbi:MAG: ComEC/Rec2 family competence protein [Elainellaceae cyanobacterium]
MMGSITGYLLCLAYVVGLLLTGIPGELGGIPTGAIAIFVVGSIAMICMPKVWRTGPKSKIWLVAGLICLFALFHFSIRVPEASETDISHQLGTSSIPTDVANRSESLDQFEVRGQIDSSPRLTRSERIQFVLRTTEARHWSKQELDTEFQHVTGRLYVTIPSDRVEDNELYPGKPLTVAGRLYHPEPAVNPGAFDFQAYLKQQGIFAGLSGKVSGMSSSVPPFPIRSRIQHSSWLLQQRILNAQVERLGEPEGLLVTAMAIGKNGADLPYDLKDQFTQAGLAHALAASGFQVSMLVSAVIVLTRRFSKTWQFWIGTGVIIGYVGLTGVQPSVLRASIMGIAALMALTMDRKVKPLGLLLVAGTLLLVVNPHWIWDLGFQFSFLATLGLLITVQPLTKRLDWVPPAIASAIAVPLAAYIWTLPLQTHVFGVISPYSILINVLATPLITLISFGSIISALGALIYPPLGSLSAWTLFYPTSGLIQLAKFASELPGSAHAIGTIPAWSVVLIYGLFGWVVSYRRQRQWWIAGLTALGLVIVPAWMTHAQLNAVILATSGIPVMVIQDHGQTALINTGKETDVSFTVMPFLRTNGINRIDWAIATHSQPDPAIDLSWQQLSRVSSAPMKRLHLREFIQINSVSIEAFNDNPAMLDFHMHDQHWLLIDCHDPRCQEIPAYLPFQHAQVLWWTGEPISPEVLNAINPQVAIASAIDLDAQTRELLASRNIKTYVVGDDGAIHWSPREGFSTGSLKKDTALTDF